MNSDPTVFPTELLNHPILTPEQEILLFELLADSPEGNATGARRLLEQVRNDVLFQLPSDETERRQWETIWSKSEDITAVIAACNQRSIALAANAYVGYDLPMTERFHAGQFGLLRAIRNFDLTRGVRFMTYSMSSIRAAMQEEDAHQNGVKRSVVGSVGVGYKFAAGYREITGSDPDEDQLYRLLVAFGDGAEGRPRVFVSDAQQVAGRIVKGPGRKLPLEDQGRIGVAGSVEYPDGGQSGGMKMEMRDALEALLESLPESQRRLVDAHFGLSGASFRETAEQLGMTVRSASDELRRILKSMRRSLAPPALSEADAEAKVQTAIEQLKLKPDSSSARVLRLTLQGYERSDIYHAFQDSGQKITYERLRQIINRFVLNGILDPPSQRPSRRDAVVAAINQGEDRSHVALRLGVSVSMIRAYESSARREGLPMPPSQTSAAIRMRIRSNLSQEEQAFGAWLAASIASRKQKTP